jgi:hypothetical protein
MIMKKIYLCFLMLIITIGFTSAQEEKLWDFEDWTALPVNNPADGENWRGTSNGSIALTETFPFGTTNFNMSTKALELNLTGDDGGLVFEGIAAFDRSKYNAVSFYIYAPGIAQWEFEMMNSGNGNRFKGTIKTDSTSINDWYEMVFEIPITVASDLTKFVMKPRKPVETGLYYIDDIKFFKLDRPAPTEIVITNPASSMMVGKELPLAINFAPEGSDKEIEFMSTKPDIATVSISGVVKGIAPGTVEIKAISQKDPQVSAVLNLTIVAPDPANTYTAFNFEASDYVPKHSAYTCQIVDNPLKDDVNSSDKVLKLDVAGAWQWMNWDGYTQNANEADKMTFKIFSETEIAAFNLEVGSNGAGSTTIASLEANKWTLITVNLRRHIKDDLTVYMFTKDKWNTGTIYMDDIMYVAGDGASYVPVSGVGKLTGATITNMDGKHTMATPEISPAEATNKNLLWSIVSSDPADAATINPKTGEISALLNGEITVTARTRDLAFHTDTVAVVIAMVDDTSINNPTVNAVRLYPNPAKDVVYLSSRDNIEQVRVYNIAGQLMLNAIVNDNQFDISSLIKGIYLVEIIAADNVRSMSKLIVR